MMSRLNVGSPTARHRRDGALDVGRVVGPAERGEHVRHHRLHADRDPVDAGVGVGGDQLLGDVVGVALDRDLGAGAQRDARITAASPSAGTSDGVPPPTNTLVGGRHPGIDGPRDLGAHGGQVVVDQVRPVGPRRERAVVAPVRAERHVDVDPERRRLTTARTATIRVAATTAAVSTRSTCAPSETRSPPAPARRATSRPPGRWPHAVGGAQRPAARLGGDGRGSTSAAATGPSSSGSHTRRDCIAASSAMRRSGRRGAGPLPVPAHHGSLG